MKQTESNFDSQAFKRMQSKTPSTTYSYSQSPMIESSQSDILTKNLTMMQSQLALKLKKQAYYLSLQTPVLQHKLELADLRLEKLKTNSSTVKNILKALSKNSNPKVHLKKVVNLEKNNEKTLKETDLLKENLKLTGKKVKNSQILKRRGTFLIDQFLSYEKEHEHILDKKKELSENLQEIAECQNKILKLYLASNARLESLMLSKEELLLSIPILDKPSSKFSAEKTEIKELNQENLKFKQIINSLTKVLGEYDKSISLKRVELNKATENLNSRKALLKVQSRFLEEKKARIEFVKKELADIQKSASTIQSRSHSNEGSAKSAKSNNERSAKNLKPQALARPPAPIKKPLNKTMYS